VTARIRSNCRPRQPWEGRALGLLLLTLIALGLAVAPPVAPSRPGAAADRLLATCSTHYPETACRCVARATPIDARESELERLARDANDPEGAYAKLLTAAVIACASEAE
jgi:hypothetical protein